MDKVLKHLGIFLVTSCVLLSAISVQAQENSFSLNQLTNPASKFPDSGNFIGSLIGGLLPLMIIFGGLLLLVMLISGGFSMLSNPTNPQEQEAGKQRITWSIVGFFLLFSGYWIAQILQIIFGVRITGGEVSSSPDWSGNNSGSSVSCQVDADCAPYSCLGSGVCETPATCVVDADCGAQDCVGGVCQEPTTTIPQINGTPPANSNCPTTGTSCSVCSTGTTCFSLGANTVACCDPVSPIQWPIPEGSICTSEVSDTCNVCINGDLCYKGEGDLMVCCNPL